VSARARMYMRMRVKLQARGRVRAVDWVWIQRGKAVLCSPRLLVQVQPWVRRLALARKLASYGAG